MDIDIPLAFLYKSAFLLSCYIYKLPNGLPDMTINTSHEIILTYFLSALAKMQAVSFGDKMFARNKTKPATTSTEVIDCNKL